MFVQATILLLCIHANHAVKKTPSLPPCGSYRDCSTGTTQAYNFHINVPSLASCYLFCHRDPECNSYSYNHKHSSDLYKHCFLRGTSNCSQEVPEDRASGWISAPTVCNNRVTPLLSALMVSNNGLLRSTKWLPSLGQNFSLIFVITFLDLAMHGINHPS